MSGGTTAAMLGGMNSDKLVVVGVAWTLLLLGLVVLRILLRRSRGASSARALRVVTALTMVMVLAVVTVGAVRVARLIDTGSTVAQRTQPDATPLVSVGDPSPPSSTTRPSADPAPTTAPVTVLGPSPAAMPQTPPVGSPAPTSSPTAVSEVGPAGPGSLSLPKRFRTYTTDGDRVSGHVDVTLDQGITVRGVGPGVYRSPTASDASATMRLVLIAEGEHLGALVSPDDPGVSFTLD